MSRLRIAIVLSAALLAAAPFALAQAPSQTPAQPLPRGLTQSGGVVMMAPIPDSDSGEVSDSGISISSERRPSPVHTLSAADHDLYTRAFDAADHGDWIAAKALADQGHDPIARRIIQWRYLLDKNSGASFAEVSAFLKTNPDWPARDAMYVRAEQALDPTMDAHAVIAWFGDRPPSSGIGKVRLGEALIAAGSTARGRDLIQQGWIHSSFDPDQEIAIIRDHGDLFSPEIDRQRLDSLIWRNDIPGARREISRVTPEIQRLGEARLALQTNPNSGLHLAAELPETLKSDPGIIFDRARTLRRQGDIDAEAPILERAPAKELAKLMPGKWWAELNLAARQAIQDSNYRSAYLLASNNGLSDGLEYSEAEFLAGWIALRLLHEPKSALEHFQNLERSSTRPISLARAHYWEGRAFEASGDVAAAWKDYHAAAASSETYYGQIALARIDATPTLHLHDISVDTASMRADFEKEDLTRATRVLTDLGVESLVRTFALRSQELNADPRHTKLLADMLVQLGFREVAVRVAKAASYDNVLLLAYTHPVIALPAYAGPAPTPEPAIVLGLIRQETEFDPDSVSGAGARGIMQMMLSSARQAASRAGIPYRPSDLLSDTAYNIQLGMTEFSGDLSDWNGSYILAAAAYNAGPGNVKKWIATYGDPRSPNVDPIDWIEMIPFNETRNYVQRVLENTQVYRNRLSGHDQPLKILVDLYRPNSPPAGVLQYTPPPAGAPGPSATPAPTPRPDPG
jgi:soluble lytic murein transglycosylase